jgi:hypothetical protein
MGIRWSNICSEERGASESFGIFNVGVEDAGVGASACSRDVSGAGVASLVASSDVCSDAASALLSFSCTSVGAASASCCANLDLSTSSRDSGGASVSAMVLLACYSSSGRDNSGGAPRSASGGALLSSDHGGRSDTEREEVGNRKEGGTESHWQCSTRKWWAGSEFSTLDAVR